MKPYIHGQEPSMRYLPTIIFLFLLETEPLTKVGHRAIPSWPLFIREKGKSEASPGLTATRSTSDKAMVPI